MQPVQLIVLASAEHDGRSTTVLQPDAMLTSLPVDMLHSPDRHQPERFSAIYPFCSKVDARPPDAASHALR